MRENSTNNEKQYVLFYEKEAIKYVMQLTKASLRDKISLPTLGNHSLLRTTSNESEWTCNFDREVFALQGKNQFGFSVYKRIFEGECSTAEHMDTSNLFMNRIGKENSKHSKLKNFFHRCSKVGCFDRVDPRDGSFCWGHSDC